MPTTPFLKGMTATFDGVTLTTIHNVKSMTGPDLSREFVETTHVGTTGGYKTFIPKPFVDPGTLTFTGECDPAAAATLTLMVNAAAPNEARIGTLAFTVCNPGLATTYKTWTCLLAFLTTCSIAGPAHDELLSVTLTFKLTGSITIS